MKEKKRFKFSKMSSSNCIFIGLKIQIARQLSFEYNFIIIISLSIFMQSRSSMSLKLHPSAGKVHYIEATV